MYFIDGVKKMNFIHTIFPISKKKSVLSEKPGRGCPVILEIVIRVPNRFLSRITVIKSNYGTLVEIMYIIRKIQFALLACQVLLLVSCTADAALVDFQSVAR